MLIIKMYKLVLIRHGQSTWNEKNLFTGWTDVPLTKRGIEGAKHAGRVLKENGYEFDIAYTSVLKRATDTLHYVLEEMGVHDLDVKKSWRLNERHYGALQGLNKKETVEKYGEEQVFKWRRSYDIRPPALEKNDKRNPANESLYHNVRPEELPLTECLKDVVERFLPYWKEEIEPAIKSGKRIIISSHGNTMRALMQYLDHLTNEDVAKLNIPYSMPIVYELDHNLKMIKHYFLGDEEEIRKITQEVMNQT